MKNIKKKNGGTRPNAGRKPKPESEKQVKLAVGIPAELNNKVKSIAKMRNMARHRVIRDSIESYVGNIMTELKRIDVSEISLVQAKARLDFVLSQPIGLGMRIVPKSISAEIQGNEWRPLFSDVVYKMRIGNCESEYTQVLGYLLANTLVGASAAYEIAVNTDTFHNNVVFIRRGSGFDNACSTFYKRYFKGFADDDISVMDVR